MLLFVVGALLAPLKAQKLDFGITIDAGSTGCRVAVYKWAHRESSDTVMAVPPFSSPVSQQVWSSKTKIPIASFTSNPTDAGPSLVPLVNFAQAKIAESGVTLEEMKRFPIFLGATAGMRIIPIASREAIMVSVRSVLSTSPFYFEPRFARVISGEEEAAYGWLTVNYLLGKLNHEAKNTVGSLDMGGASTQISFAASDVLASFFPMNLGTISHSLYAHSYLSFGNFEAKRRINELVVATDLSRMVHSHPCLPKGHSEIFTMITSNVSAEFVMEGSSDSAGCEKLAVAILDLNTACWTDTCGVAGDYQPPLPKGMKFLGFSTFANVVRSLNLPSNASLQQFWEVSNAVCESNVSALRRLIPDPKLAEFLPGYCYQSKYFVELLKGWGFPMDHPGTIVFDVSLVSVLDGNVTEIGWALGNMVYQSNLLSWEINNARPFPPSSSSYKAATIVLGVLLGLCCVLFGVSLKRISELRRVKPSTTRASRQRQEDP